MKTQRIWLLFCALLVAVFLIYYFVCQLTPATEKTGGTVTKVKSSAVKVVTVTNAFKGNPTTTQRIVSLPQNPVPTVNDRQKTNEIRQYMESLNKPIVFYGQVIDQNENPIPGVKVTLRVRHIKVVVPAPWGDEEHNILVERETDSAGRFEINDVTGDSVTIKSVEKEGFRLSPKTEKIYGYSGVPKPHLPDLQNPVIIKMWKLGEPQQLIQHYLSGIGVPVDGKPVQFDLCNGKKVVSGGQLIVRLKRDPQVLPPRYGRYDWSLELEIPNGGLIANKDEFMYYAPDSDYHTVFKFDMPKTAENWTTAVDQQFYIELDNGKFYGSLIVRLSTIHDTPPLGITLDIVINPNGSQSLQP